MRLRFDDCLLDLSAHLLVRGGEPRALTPKAFLVLSALVRARPGAVTKDELYALLWPDVTVEPGNLHNLVAEVREAIGDSRHQIVRTLHRVGYAFAAPVEELAGPCAHLVFGTRTVPLYEGENVIGREVVGSPDVSRRHATVVIHEGRASLEDLGSKNGTWVGTRRIAGTVALSDGDEIAFGRTVAVVRLNTLDSATITALPLRGSSG